jgi:hypothetical protein
VFSIETEAFLCDVHALSGVTMKLALLATDDSAASIDVISGRNRVEKRTKAITQPTTHDETTKGGEAA